MEHLRIYNTLDSSNKEAQRLLAKSSVPHGLTLLALEQTHGTGQFGRNWYAQPGQHLAMSVILKPKKMPVSELPHISMKSSLAILNALETIAPGMELKIKWPNDIYSGKKKLSGVLIENAIAGKWVQHIIIGIGVNVNEQLFPAELPNATSLHLEGGNEYSVHDIALAIRHHILEILDAKEEDWRNKYNASLFGLGQTFDFDHEGTTVTAQMCGVDNEGRIVLKFEDGHQQPFYSHEIKWRLR